MDDAALADLEHENMVGAMSALCANVAGAEVRRAGGATALATGLPFVLFNQVVIEDEATAPAAVTDAVRFMRERGGPFVVNLRSGRDDRFVGLLGELGLVEVSERPWMPGMAWHPLPDPVTTDAPHGHEVRRVTDVPGLEDHIRTGAAGFEMPEAIIRAIMVPSLLERTDYAIYVGYTEGRPVSTGLGIPSGRTIGVYNIATIAAARGRGYGAAMTRRVVADGVAGGCDVAILQASDMGLRVYERLGFRTVIDYVGYVEPTAGA